MLVDIPLDVVNIIFLVVQYILRINTDDNLPDCSFSQKNVEVVAAQNSGSKQQAVTEVNISVGINPTLSTILNWGHSSIVSSSTRKSLSTVRPISYDCPRA